MKQIFSLITPRVTTLVLASLLATSLTVALAGTSQLYIDDLDFDYDLDSLVTEASSYDGFSEAFRYNSEDNQAENVAVYVHLTSFHPSGELRVYVDSANELNSTLPMATAIVPDGSSSVADLSGGFEVVTQAVTNKDIGLNLKVAGASAEDVMADYMSNLSALEYVMTPIAASVAGRSDYRVSKKYANYVFSFKQVGDSVEVAIKGM